MISKTALLAMVGLAVSAGHADAAQVYFNDFEHGTGLGGAGEIVDVQGYDGVNGISGSFWFNDTKVPSPVGTQTIPSTLELAGLGAHNILTLSFDIAFIDSWDGVIGRVFGDDYFNIVLDDLTVLQTTNFGGLADELSDGVYGFFGFTERYDDEAYRYSAIVPHIGSTASFSFFADGRKWQAGADESWAIDNLSISTGWAPVPAPASLLLLASGLGFIAFKRRRKPA